MHSYKKLVKAKTLLGLHDKDTLSEIKLRYKNLMKKWHPDKHTDDIKNATKMSAQINEAYELILNYCNKYEYRFDEEFLKDQTLTPQAWWEKRFGGR